MADIELVIKIPEEDYKIMKHNIAINNPLCPLSQEEMVSKVANGTPLPKEREPKKKVLEELAKEDLQVLSLAFVYAKNLQMYGVDVTKAICSAIENVAMLEKAYQKGYYDAMQRANRMEEFDKKDREKPNQTLKSCKNCGYPYKLAGKCYSCENYSQWIPIDADKGE